MPDDGLSLLNVFEVEAEGGRRHLVCFQEAVLAGAVGILERSIVGEFTPGPGGAFDPAAFRQNPAFREAATRYLEAKAANAPEIIAGAKVHPDSRLELFDPRHEHGPDQAAEPTDADVLGSFAVDEQGRIVPESFRPNPAHLWFHPESGPSGLLSDRRYYEWLHPVAATGDDPKP